VRNVATNMVRNMASNTGTDVGGDRKRNTDVETPSMSEERD
jgi:hypothetical protein